jgi:hypothetical protein
MVPSMSLDEPYGLGRDSRKQEGVPEGTITKYNWVDKKMSSQKKNLQNGGAILALPIVK